MKAFGRLYGWCKRDSIRATSVRCSKCHSVILRATGTDNGHVGFAWLACDCKFTFSPFSMSGGATFDGAKEYRSAWRTSAEQMVRSGGTP